MTVSAEILADSIHPVTRSRLTTMRIVVPRAVWDEFLTHRSFGRCAASMRAIPSKRQRANVIADPWLPPFGENKGGMQQGEDLPPIRSMVARFLWLACMRIAVLFSAALDHLGVHKQVASRVLFPWSHITAIVTGTDAAYANFYALRRHEAAEPTIHALADIMAAAHRISRPQELRIGDWHLPLVPDAERYSPAALPIETLVQRSVARAARTSYLKPDGGQATLAEDLALFTRLVHATPPHASPAEHQAYAGGPGPLAGCFGASSGWVQFRKTIAGEVATDLVRYLGNDVGAPTKKDSKCL